MTGQSDAVTIPRQEYEELQEAYDKLCALEGAGVDNWDGYDYAMEILEQERAGRPDTA